MSSLFRKPSESDITESKKLGASGTVKALFSAQWQFYKFGYDTMVKISVIELIIILIMGIVLFILAANGNPEPRYFLVNQHNQFVPIEPLYEPVRKDEQVRQFVTDAVLASMNFTYDDYKQRLNSAAVYYTDDGIVAWNEALASSRLIEQVLERQLLVRTQIINAPVIDKEKSKPYSGVYVWAVYVDVLRSLSDRNETKSKSYRYKVLVRRVPSSERASGLAIYRINEVNSLN